jgi:hypothetical protein
MSSTSIPPDNTTDRLSPAQRAVHSRSTTIMFGTIFTSLRRFLQETSARYRVLGAIHAAAVLDLEIRATLRPLVKCILVFIGSRLVGWPSMRALFTQAIALFELRNV